MSVGYGRRFLYALKGGQNMKLFAFVKDRLFKPAHEPEYDEPVEHDVVMRMIDGKLTEVTKDDPEVRKQQ